MSHGKLAILFRPSAFIVPGLLLAQTIEFNRDIRPILSDKCFACRLNWLAATRSPANPSLRM